MAVRGAADVRVAFDAKHMNRHKNRRQHFEVAAELLQRRGFLPGTFIPCIQPRSVRIGGGSTPRLHKFV